MKFDFMTVWDGFEWLNSPKRARMRRLRLAGATRKTSLVAALLFAMPAHAGDLIGRASAIDGDTLVIRDTRIRIHAIDAPESWQTCTDQTGVEYRCGKLAAEALQRILDSARPLTCTEVDRDRYGRSVAVCRTARGLDVGAEMIRTGWAIRFERYARKGEYALEQKEAATARRGIWAGWFLDPAIERARRRPSS